MGAQRPAPATHDQEDVMNKARAIVLTALLLTGQASASWLSRITGIDIDFTSGTVRFAPPQPQAVGEMLRNLPKDAFQYLTNPYEGMPGSGDQTRRKTHLAFQTEQIPEVQVEQRSLAEYDALVAVPGTATLDEMLASVFPEGDA